MDKNRHFPLVQRDVQLSNFREALIRFSGNGDIPELEGWHDAFNRLGEYLDGCSEARKVVFFDELPWADTHGSELVEELEYFWANWVQNRDDIVFIISTKRGLHHEDLFSQT